jgi:heptosyltransferase-3
VTIAPSRILIFRIGQLGDTLVAIPAIWAVRRQFPDAHIALLSTTDVTNRHVTPERVMPSGVINEWLTYDADESGTDYWQGLKLAWRLRRGRFDTLIYLAPRSRPAEHVRRDLALFRLAGVRTFIGHRDIEPLPAKRGSAPLARVEHEADHLLSRLARSGIKTPVHGDGSMDLQITVEESVNADAWLRARLHGDDDVQLLAVCPGSKWPSKVWPEERFVDLGRQLIGKHGLTPLIVGGSEEAQIGERLLNVWGAGVNAAGSLSVRESAALLARCRLYVGNDTGAMHLAAAVGTPCVAIFAALDWPGRWYPYGTGHQVLRQWVPCEGCRLRICDHDLECLRRITVDDVMEACRIALETRPRSVARAIEV